MRMSQTAEYALRAMAQLAILPKGQGARAGDISKAASIPPHYLSKIMRRLVASGLLTSVKGHGGGFQLAASRKEIRFKDILEAVDEAPQKNHCAFGYDRCNAKNPCVLHPLFSEFNRQLNRWAVGCSLDDLGAPPRPNSRKPAQISRVRRRKK